MFHLNQLYLDGGAPAGAPSAFTAGCELPDMLARFFAEPSTETGSEWSELNVVLDAKMAPGNAGPYRFALTPHTRFVQDLGDGVWHKPNGEIEIVRQITIKKNSQGAWTEAVLNIIRRRVAVRPCNVLYVIDSITQARLISSVRLRPSLENCAATAQAMEEDAPDAEGTLLLNLRDMFIAFAGGGSIGAIANKPIELGVCDEADKIPRITGGHGHVASEMKARFKSIEGSLFILLSAPNEAQDVTTQEYELGTCHKYFVPCPHCNHFQEMVQERVKYDHCRRPNGTYDKKRVLREAYYECERVGASENPCPGGKIYDHDKPAMAARGEWRQTNPDAEPGHISFQSSDLFSLFPGASLGLIALDLIKMHAKPLEKRAIQRDRFGLEFRPAKAEIKSEDLLKLIGPYKRGTIPVESVYVGIGSDYQGEGPKWVKGAWARNGDLYIVDWGDPLGLDDIAKAAAVPVVETRTNRECFLIGGLLDEGWRQKDVLKFCLRDARENNYNEFRFLSSKGRGNIQNAGALVVESARTVDGVPTIAYHFNDDKFKADLYVGQIKEFDKIKTGRVKRARIWFPEDVTPEFLNEMMGESLLPEVNAFGYTVLKWKKVGPNHWGDGVKNLNVLWHVVGGEVLAAIGDAA